MEQNRYIRQIQFAPLGPSGQQKLTESCALVCGCGALGSLQASWLARAGVGRLRLVDRDFLELSNLQRQTLFDEQDVRSGLPKAILAQQKLRQVNSSIQIDAEVVDVDHRNIERLVEGVDVIVDGTDNFETRFLVNDASVRWNIPWVYGGCLGAEGQTMTIVPQQTPCLRCLLEEPPPPGTIPTCDTAGILGPAIGVIASIQCSEAIKILSGHRDQVSPFLTVVDLWEARVRQLALDSIDPHGTCPACKKRELKWLEGRQGSQSAVLCGRHAVQLSFPEPSRLPLDQLARKLSSVGRVQQNPFLVRCQVDPYQITVFADGRAIIGGTEDVTEARAVYARYVGA